MTERDTPKATKVAVHLDWKPHVLMHFGSSELIKGATDYLTLVKVLEQNKSAVSFVLKHFSVLGAKNSSEYESWKGP